VEVYHSPIVTASLFAAKSLGFLEGGNQMVFELSNAKGGAAA
jgi:hypothetical protein